MVKCFCIDSNSYRYLILEDGVLAPTNIEVKQGEVREFNAKSFEIYRSNLQIESLDNYGKVVFHKIICSLIGVADGDIVNDEVIVCNNNAFMTLNGYINKFENASIYCSMRIDLPSFKIAELDFSDKDYHGNSHSFKVVELCGFSVLTQKKEIIDTISAIRRSYKKDIKLITEDDNLLVKLINKMPSFSAPSHDTTLESMAKYRQDNNLYMGTIGSRGVQKASDAYILNRNK